MREDPTDEVPSWLAPRVRKPPMSTRTLVVAWLSVTWGVVLCLEWIARTYFDEPGLELLSDRSTHGIGAAGVVWCAAAACLAARKQWATWVPLVGALVYVWWLIEGVSEHTAGKVVLIASASVVPLVAGTMSFVLIVEDLHERMDNREQRLRSDESPEPAGEVENRR